MTPEEIVTEWENALKKNLNVHEYHPIKESYIEAIKQYAKQMCDKQRMECGLQWCGVGNNDVKLNGDAILNAPYPKELQD